MNRIARPFIIALGLLAVGALRAPAASAADSASACVRLREAQTGDGLAFAIDNDCERSLSCSITWTVQCESATGKVTRSTKEGARFVIGASASQSVAASAKSCGDNWKIADVSWSCAPTR